VSKLALISIFNLVYDFAIGIIQSSEYIDAYARELHRLADRLEKDKPYKPNLREFGW
jgi:hypothetical protein